MRKGGEEGNAGGEGFCERALASPKFPYPFPSMKLLLGGPQGEETKTGARLLKKKETPSISEDTYHISTGRTKKKIWHPKGRNTIQEIHRKKKLTKASARGRGARIKEGSRGVVKKAAGGGTFPWGMFPLSKPKGEGLSEKGY